MATDGLVALRHARVRNAFGRVKEAVEAWRGRWKEPGLQSSQIKVCGQVLDKMLDRIGARLADLPADERALAVGREIESDLTLVEGLFRLLAERFDQRHEPELAPTLRAADELIWSCVQQIRVHTGASLPLPLAYIDPAFSPSATPRIKPPPALPARDRLLAGMLRVLPVPLIGLPTGIVDEPWWLVLIAHEVGHHVQYDAEADEGVVKSTGVALKEATGDATWEAWRHEVFADLFAVLALGPVAIEATAELEWDEPEGMAAVKNRYPPVLIRLALMAECAAAVGYADVPFRADSWDDILAKVAAPRREIVAAQRSCVAAAVAAVLDLKLGGGTLRYLAADVRSAAAETARTAATLQQMLLGKDVGPPKPSKALPLSAVREAFRAYRGLAKTADPAQRTASAEPEQRADERRLLRERTVSVIANSGEKGVKLAVVHTPADTAKIVDRMFEVLRTGEAEGGSA